MFKVLLMITKRTCTDCGVVYDYTTRGAYVDSICIGATAWSYDRKSRDGDTTTAGEGNVHLLTIDHTQVFNSHILAFVEC